MLCVKCNDGKSFEWHVGQWIGDLVSTESVSSIQADGDELILIREFCKNIPDSHYLRVVSWYGDHAKFIFQAIKSDSRKPRR